MVADQARLQFDVLRELAYTALTSSFQVLGGVVTIPLYAVKIQNTTNSDLDISLDGVNIGDRLPPNSFALYDFAANHVSPGISLMPANTQFYVRLKSGTASPTSGYVAMTVIADLTNL